jgi:hypothetical protein
MTYYRIMFRKSNKTDVTKSQKLLIITGHPELDSGF